MTDGLSLTRSIERARERLTEIEGNASPQIDLTNYAAWLELQSPTTIAGILDLAANELYRRQDWPSIAGRLKDVVRDLRAVARVRGPLEI